MPAVHRGVNGADTYVCLRDLAARRIVSGDALRLATLLWRGKASCAPLSNLVFAETPAFPDTDLLSKLSCKPVPTPHGYSSAHSATACRT